MEAQFVPSWQSGLAQFVASWSTGSQAGVDLAPSNSAHQLLGNLPTLSVPNSLLYPDPVFGFRWIRQFGKAGSIQFLYSRLEADGGDLEPIMRFSPMFWTTNFNRPMVASVVQEGDQDLLLTACFYTQRDLCGLIWESEDFRDHQAIRYNTDRDYSGCVLQFEWEAEGDVAPLNGVNGPVLTIEGRLPNGQAKIWYVRLWNYADPLTRQPFRAFIRLNFDDLAGGFLLPEEADPVYPGAIDRMFISLIPAGYTGADLPLDNPTVARVRLRNVFASGPNSNLIAGSSVQTGHGLRMATGYDDLVNLTPTRILWNMQKLSYVKWLNHYVGMSHYYRLAWNAETSRYVVVTNGQLLNAATLQWHRNLADLCKEARITPIFSLSYELFNANCPASWRQMNAFNEPALTGWDPPSSLLSPCNADAMSYLAGVAREFCTIQQQAGLKVHFQIGEPWWWVNTFADSQTALYAPCCYDAATVARYTTEFSAAPPLVYDVRNPLNTEQLAYMAWCGSRLAESTASITASVKQAFSGATTYLLFYSPQVFGLGSDATVSLNMPTEWRFPAFDVLQLEDYDFVIENDLERAAQARDEINFVLRYPIAKQHYFSGFVLRPADRDDIWPNVMDFATDAKSRAVPEIFLWSYSQIVRDAVHPQVKVLSPLAGVPPWSKVLPRENLSVLVG